jgi:hypothetical protein
VTDRPSAIAATSLHPASFLPRRTTTWLLIVWSGLMVWLYVGTISANCGNENDCGAAIGLGFLMTVMIWLAGFAVVLLARLVGGWVKRRREAASPGQPEMRAEG